MSVAITRDSSRVCEISKKMHKDESLKRPQLQRTTPLVTQNWTRWQVRLGASFCERVLFREGPDQGHLHVNVKTQKRLCVFGVVVGLVVDAAFYVCCHYAGFIACM